jgi:hypothetical protein
MRPRSSDQTLDYFPLFSFGLFWFLAAVTGAIQIGDPSLLKLGIVTLPAVAATIYCAVKIHAGHRSQDVDKESG